MFTPEGLATLDRQPYDPAVKASYDLLADGLFWRDEMPSGFVQLGPSGILPDRVAYGCLIAYRAALTLGAASPFRPVWEQVVAFAPNWPGLRPERRGEKARKRLLAAKRRADACLDELEKQMSSPQRGGSQ